MEGIWCAKADLKAEPALVANSIAVASGDEGQVAALWYVRLEGLSFQKSAAA